MSQQLSKSEVNKLLKIHAGYICKLARFYAMIDVDYELQPPFIMALTQAKQLLEIMEALHIPTAKWKYLRNFHLSQFIPPIDRVDAPES